MTQSDVLIIGGGISGLTCAVALAREGLKVRLLEKHDALGGRASSWADKETGDTIDIGPHIFITEYPNFFQLLELLGTRDQVVWQEQGLFVHMVEGPEAMPYRISKLPTPLHFMPSLLRDRRMSLYDTLSASRVSAWALKASGEELAALDDENALPFLRRMGVSENHIQRYWAFASMSIMNVPIELCSAGALLSLHRRLLGNNDFKIGFAAKGLGTLYTQQSATLVEARGGKVETNRGVRALETDGRRVVGAVLDDGEVVKARRVVAAVPPHALRALLPKEWLHRPRFEKLVRFVPCPYICVYLWFDKKLTPLQFWARAFKPNDLNLDFYDLTNINPEWRGRPSLVASNIIYSHRAHGLTDQEIVDRTVHELSEFLPLARRATLRHAAVNRVPMAIHCPFPGTEAARPRVDSEDDGLILAGDWVATGLPSSMESAARSGWLAAEAILAKEGKQRSLAIAHVEMNGPARWIRSGVDLLPHRLARRAVRRKNGDRRLY